MKKRKLIYGLVALSFLLSGCDPTTSSEEVVDSTTSVIQTNADKFASAGYISAINGWPTVQIKALLTKENVAEAWINEYIPALDIPLTAQVYAQNYQEELDLIVFKTMQFAYPSADNSKLTTYLGLVDEAKWDIAFDEESESYALTTADGDNKVAIGLTFIEETEFLPAATYFSFIVREKEEFVGAPKPVTGSIRRAIAFGNDFRIVERSMDKVVWAFHPVSFMVEKAASEITVGNIPNNNGVGYLMDPLRIYDEQKLTFVVPEDGRLSQVIIHLRDFTVGGNPVVSLDGLPLFADDPTIRTFTTPTSILYHFLSDMHTFALTVSGDVRLTDVVIIYTPIE